MHGYYPTATVAKFRAATSYYCRYLLLLPSCSGVREEICMVGPGLVWFLRRSLAAVGSIETDKS